MPNLSRDAIDKQQGHRTKLGKIFAGEIKAADGHVFDAEDLALITELIDEGKTYQVLSDVMREAKFQISDKAIRSYLLGLNQSDGPLWGCRRTTGE